MLYTLPSKTIQGVEQCSFIAASADVIGSVELSAGVSIWFGAVLRGDADVISIGEATNIQDGSVLHVDPGYPLEVGRFVTVGHRAVLHGCKIGDNSLIGINAVLLNGVEIGENCLVGAGALLTENTKIPDGSLVLGSPAKVRRSTSEEEQAFIHASAEHYRTKGDMFKAQLQFHPQ